MKLTGKLLAAALIPAVAATIILTSDGEKDAVNTDIETVAAGVELVELRTETTEVYTTDTPGKRVMRVYSKPVHYRDKETGRLEKYDFAERDVDASVKGDARRKHDKYVKIGNHGMGWMKGKKHDYRFNHESGYYVQYTLLTVQAGMAVETETNRDGVKQTYTMSDSTWTGRLRWTLETDATMTVNGAEVVYTDSTGAFLFRTSSPVAWDADGKDVPVTVTVQGDTLTYDADVTGVVWPVVVDPSTIIGETTVKTGSGSAYNSSYQTARSTQTAMTTYHYDLYTGQVYNSGNGLYTVFRGYLTFDTSSLPNTAIIDSARVKLTVSQDYSTADFDIYLVEGTFNASGDMGGEWFNDFVGWQSSGAYSVTSLADSVGTAGISPGDTLVFTLNGDGFDAVNRTGYTTMTVLSYRDVEGTQPSVSERVRLEYNTPCIEIWYKTIKNPTSFTLSLPADIDSTDAILVTVTPNHATGVDSFYVKNYADEFIKRFPSLVSEAMKIDGLDVNTKYVFKAVVDSLTESAESAPDSITTRANPPTLWAFENSGIELNISVGFGVNSNPAGTEFAVRDSTNQKWVQTDGTLDTTAVWDTYATWSSVTITETNADKGDIIKYGVVARNGDEVETEYLWGDIIVYSLSPSNFTLSASSTTSIISSWANESANYDSLLIMNSPENTGVVYADSPTDESTLVTGLTPNTLYTYFVRADSAGVKGDSNADSTYTLANVPSGATVSAPDTSQVTFTWTANSNPDSTMYAVSVYNATDDSLYYWTGAALSGTASWKTRPAWGVPITITGLRKDKNYYIGVKARNGDEVETAAVSVGVRTAERTQDSDPIAFTKFYTSQVTSAVYDSARVEQHPDSITTANADKLGQSAAKMVARMSIDIPIPNVSVPFSGFQLHLRGKADYSTTDFLIRGSYGGWGLEQTDERYYTWPGYTQNMSAYSLINQMWEDFSTSGFIIGDNVLIANSSGIGVAEQAKGTTAKWYLISSRDVSATSPSGNEYVEFWSTSPDSSYAIYQYEYVEAVPYGLTGTPLTTSSVAVTWNDSTLTNTGFLIVDGSTGVAYSDTLAHDAEADTLTGLTPNLLLSLKVKIIGGTLDGQLSSAVSVATYPNPFAAAPDTSGQTQTTITVKPDTTGWGNPSDTDFALYFITTSGDTSWVDRTATPYTLKAGLGINDSWGWGTYDQWGGASGTEVTGLDAGRTYTVGTMTRGRDY